MPLPRYKDIVDLIKQGKTTEAQEQILALRGAALELATHTPKSPLLGREGSLGVAYGEPFTK